MAFKKYGKRTNKRTYGGTTKRYAAAQKKAKAKRTLTVRKARARPVKAIVRNAKAIKRLKQEQYGPIQRQISIMHPNGGALHVTAGSPLLFQVNNINTGIQGPYMWHINGFGNVNHTSHSFVKWADPADMYHDKDDDHYPNGPKLKLLSVELEFEFSGFVDCTHISVHIIRQKKMVDPNFYNQNKADQFLPMTLTGMKNIAGFDPNRRDRSVFQVIAQKKIFMNSKGSANVLDTIANVNTIEGSTAPCKTCKIYYRPNQVMKTLVSPTIEDADVHAGSHPPTVDATMRPHSSVWAYDNLHPLASHWCLISCDDKTALGDIVTGDAVSVKINRRLVWRDPIA